MSMFGLSPGDLIQIIAWTNLIYEKGFSKAQAADRKYLQFGQEIKHFAETLQQLSEVFQYVKKQREKQPWLPYDATRLTLNIKPLPELTGDFRKTLQQCQNLLNDHSKFRHTSSGFVDNIQWWLGVETEVNRLKEQISFHTTKILLIIKPVEFQLLEDLRQEIKDGVREVRNDIGDVRTLVEDIKGLLSPSWAHSRLEETAAALDLPDVAAELDRRFTEAALTEKPGLDLQAFPLKDGFDALVYHFNQSTIEFYPRHYARQNTPEITQYLNLVKSRWILQKLFESSNFVRNSLWGRCFETIQNNILSEYFRFKSGELSSPGDEVTFRLEGQYFSIFMEEQNAEPAPPTMTAERPSEEKILEIGLAKTQTNRQPSLVIFRKSDTELRMVYTTQDEQNDLFYEAESLEANMSITRFIPLYAYPNSASADSTNNVLFCNSQGKTVRAFSLETLNDVYSLQQAVTGYKVALDTANVSWATYKTTEAGRGRVQIWRPKSLPRIISPDQDRNPSPNSEPGKPSRATTSLSSITMAETLASTARGTLVHGTNGPAVSFERPEPPVLVIFTLFKDAWSFLHCPLDKGVFINPRSCHCDACKGKGSKSQCRRIIIETTKGKLEVKRHSADEQEGVNAWDLSVLRRPRPHSIKDSVNVSMTAKYMVLTFTNPQEKADFQDTFDAVQKLKATEDKAYMTAITRRR